MNKLQQAVREKVGYPLTLARVLHALNQYGNTECFYADSYGRIMRDAEVTHDSFNTEIQFLCNWQLLNEDGTECTFEQQSEETQNAIATLLGVDYED